MKKYFYMLPRCSGKTNMAIYEFLKDPENTLLVVCNHDLLQYVYDKIGYKHENVITNRRFASFIVNKRFKTIILDEYLFFSNYKEIYETISSMPGIENLYIYTTSNKCYNILFFDYIKKCKTANISYEYLVRDRPIIREKLCELYYNFITDPDICIIDNIPTVFHIKPERFRFNNNEQYDVEFLNKWLSDNCFDLNIIDYFLKLVNFKNTPIYDIPKESNKLIDQIKFIMTEQQIKQKLIDIGVWDAFDRNYMDEFNRKEDHVNTTEKYIAFELKNGFRDIIEGAFAWDCTPEGGYYWDKISNEKIDDNVEKNFDPKDGDIVSWDSEGDFGDEVEHCVAIVRGDNGWVNTTFHPEINIYAILNPDGVIFFSKSVTDYPFNFRLADDSDIKKLISGLKKEGKMWNNELKRIDELRKPSEELVEEIVKILDSYGVIYKSHDISTEIAALMQNCENQEESRKNVQICYKTNEPCKHGCDGLCKESC